MRISWLSRRFSSWLTRDQHHHLHPFQERKHELEFISIFLFILVTYTCTTYILFSFPGSDTLHTTMILKHLIVLVIYVSVYTCTKKIIQGKFFHSFAFSMLF